MGLCQCVSDLNSEFERLIETHSLTRDQRIQRLALHVLHDNEVGALLVRDIVDGDDVGMVQRGGRLSFLNKPPLALWFANLVFRQYLDGNNAVQPCVLGLIHFTHPARAEWADNLVSTQLASGGYTHGLSPNRAVQYTTRVSGVFVLLTALITNLLPSSVTS